MDALGKWRFSTVFSSFCVPSLSAFVVSSDVHVLHATEFPTSGACENIYYVSATRIVFMCDGIVISKFNLIVCAPQNSLHQERVL